MSETKTTAEMAAEVKAYLEGKTEEVKRIAENALTEAQRTGAVAAETKAVADKTLTELGTLREQLAGVEQKMARRPGEGDGEIKSFGAQFVGSKAFEDFRAGGSTGKVRVELKTVTSTSSGQVFSYRDGQIDNIPQRRLVVRSLLDVVETTSASVDSTRQTTRTNNAAVVAEGAAKPYSDYAWEQFNVPMRTVAHLSKVTRQALDDATQLQNEIDSEMRYGLAYAEEAELLNGDGTGQHLNGLTTQATAFAAPITVADATMIDTLRLALLQAELALFPADGIVMNPSDWAHIELTKDSQGRYIWSDPTNSGTPRLWGKPVVSTQAMTIDKFLVGGFKLQRLYDRMSPEVLISSENADDFEKNLYTMRCEERIGLAVRRRQALIYGDFGNVS